MSIGVVGFLAPYLGVLLYAHYLLGWPWPQAQIAGISLSTTSVAVVYAVMVETGFNKTEIGKIILAACFVNDLGTVLALGIVFAHYDLWLAALRRRDGGGLWLLPRFAPWFFGKVGHRVSEPETKFVALVLLGLGGHGHGRRQRGGAAGLPRRHGAGAGLPRRSRAAAPHAHHRLHHPDALLLPQGRLAGRLPAPSWPQPGSSSSSSRIKMATKFVGILPLTKAFRFEAREGMYTTLLMSTGLTFGTISALFGLTNHIIDQAQYTILVTAVIGSAVVPTLIAQRWFQPALQADPARSRAAPAGEVR